MQDVRVSEVAWPVDSAGRPVADAADHFWQARLDEARSDDRGRRPPGVDDVIRHTLRPAPDVRLFSRFNGTVSEGLRVSEALRDAGASGAWFEAEYYVFDESELEQVTEANLTELEQVTERILTELAMAYRPYPRDASRDPRRTAFHLIDGAIERPFVGKEAIAITFEEPGLGLGEQLNIDMRTDYDTETPSAIARWRSIRATAWMAGVSFDRIRARKRRVAGMDGEEVIHRGRKKGEEDELMFEWYHPGIALSPFQPLLTIEMTASPEDVEAKIAYWDRLLESFRPLPQKAAP